MKHTIWLFLFCSFTLLAQRDTLPMEVYQRAISYTFQKLVNKKVYHLQTPVNWNEDSTGLWFAHFDQNGKTYTLLDFQNNKKRPLFDHESLTAALNDQTGKSYKASDLPLSAVQVRHDMVSFSLNGNSYEWKDSNKKLSSLDKKDDAKGSEFESQSPDGKWTAFVKDYNLHVRENSTGKTIALSKDGAKEYVYASWYGWFDEMFGENTDREAHFSVQWSPDSRYLATQICDTRNAQKMYLLNHAIDTLYRASLSSYYRGSPGDTNMVLVKPVLFDLNNMSELELNLPVQTHVNSVGIRFTDDSKQIIASWLPRGFKSHLIHLITLPDTKHSVLWEETTATSVDHSGYWYVPEWGKLILESEKSGWLQLYEIDLKTGKTIALTSGDFVVNSVEFTDKKNGWVYFLASGKEKNENPYHQKLYRVKSGGGALELLTPEPGHHQVNIDPTGRYFTDAMSTVTTETRTVLRKTDDGEIAAEIASADVSRVQLEGWIPPMTFETIGKDGKTPIYGAVWRPNDFDPNQKYPVIDATYTGPHTNQYPKSFDMAFRNQSWAELGFVVFVIDGLGTAGRSADFRAVSYQNMGDNLKDHVLAIQAMAYKYPWIDASRVGIFGHSAGGYDTGHAMLAFPDFYKVGVASAGDHDFRMEKAWWPEMYMGWPVTEKYEEASNISLAANLKGKLLLVHGGLDHNVNPSATFKLAEALVNANKEFDLLILPSQRHGFQGKASEYFQKRRWNYFINNLLGLESRWDYQITE